jgi:hypothetical protein
MRRALHFAWLASVGLSRGVALYLVTGDPITVVPYTVFELAKRVPYGPINSSIHLKLKQSRKTKRFLDELARTSGISSIRVLITSSLDYSGILAVRQRNRGFVFVEAEEGFDQHSSSIKIARPDDTHVTLRFSALGRGNPVEWRVSLSEVLPC